MNTPAPDKPLGMKRVIKRVICLILGHRHKIQSYYTNLASFSAEWRTQGYCLRCGYEWDDRQFWSTTYYPEEKP
jgi:hypothetical protein